MEQRIEGTQRVGPVCFGSVRAARKKVTNMTVWVKPKLMDEDAAARTVVAKDAVFSAFLYGLRRGAADGNLGLRVHSVWCCTEKKEVSTCRD